MNTKYKHESILLFSSGLDSFIAWHYLGKPPALFCDARQSYVAKELHAVKLLARRCRMRLYVDRTLDLSSWEQRDYYIPYRNVFFAMVASLYAPSIYLIGIKGDRVDDNNPRATALMGSFLNHFNSNSILKITSPFYRMSKSQTVRWYIRQGLPVRDLLATRSCYDKSTAAQCGRCPSCFRRWVALEHNGIREHYDAPPWLWSGVGTYLRKMKAGSYDPQRTRETMEVLRRFRTIS